MISLLDRDRRPVRAAWRTTKLTGQARLLGDNEVIVSKTDLKGRILYTNRLFVKISGYCERELIGAPHSIIRHPDMPRAVFALLWSRLQAGDEVSAYVVNLCRNGDHYWVLAHVTPSFDADGSIVGYHSNRRSPLAEAITAIEPIYAELRGIELAAPDKKQGLEQSLRKLNAILDAKGMTYDAFVHAL